MGIVPYIALTQVLLYLWYLQFRILHKLTWHRQKGRFFWLDFAQRFCFSHVYFQRASKGVLFCSWPEDVKRNVHESSTPPVVQWSGWENWSILTNHDFEHFQNWGFRFFIVLSVTRHVVFLGNKWVSSWDVLAPSDFKHFLSKKIIENRCDNYLNNESPSPKSRLHQILPSHVAIPTSPACLGMV